MIGKGRNEVMVLIDSQYEFLSYLITDVAKRYYNDSISFDNMAKKDAEESSGGDVDVYMSIINSYDRESMKLTDFCAEAWKVIFVSIYAYLETVLYKIIDYYGIKNSKQEFERLIKVIKQHYYETTKKELIISKDEYDNINEVYRPLRVQYVHGKVSSKNTQKLLYDIVASKQIVYSDYCIINHSFLEDALNNVFDFVKSIELAYENEKISPYTYHQGDTNINTQ